MQKDVLVVLVNSNSLESSLDGLREIEEKLIKNCEVLLVDNGGVEEDDLRRRYSDFSCVSEYINLSESYDIGVVLNKISPSINKFQCKKIYWVISNHKQTVAYLPVLLSMSEVSKDDVLGIKGGSVFSAFFYNIPFFQKKTNTEWLDFNGILISKKIWCDKSIKLDLRYYKEFFQVDYGFQLRRSGYKLFKLKPYLFAPSTGMDSYFRMRNPFLFMKINYGFKKYPLGIIYFIFQLPLAIFKFSKNRNYLFGLLDGIKLLFFMFPSSTS